MHHAFSEAHIVAGYLIFLASYLVFAIGKFPGWKIDRPGMAIIGAVLMFAFRILGPGDSLRYINFATIVLLFSMMLIVGNLHLSGFFDRVALFAVARMGRHHLLPAIIFTSGILSAFFVNDIICLVMVPFVLTITRRMNVPPARYLLAVATASNIGSVATITGNPQNILIGSFSGIPYRSFLAHLGPVAIVGLLLDWLVLHFVGDGQTLDDNNGVVVEVTQGAARSLGKPVLVTAAVLAGFMAGAPPALVAAVGAAILLITRSLEPRLVYDEVDWGLLVFFIGLFLIVGGAEQVGLTSMLLEVAQRWNLHNAGILTIVTAALSNLVSNVPAVMLLKSLPPGFQNPQHAWLVLAMASTLAGNLTITGSIANIIVVERSRPAVHIGFWDYFRVGLPVTAATLLFGWLWLSWMA
ncbi:MAG: anion transporter [Terriglobales bacterium]|jgi:Na+/H+ antiporter NhaD/arsenite permease-like protein